MAPEPGASVDRAMPKSAPTCHKSGVMRRLLLLSLWLCPVVATAQTTTICVDPGHGGADPGAVGCGFEEEDVVIDTSLRLRDLLTAAGFRVVMTRVNDSAVSLAGRSSLANSEGAARFMSIHANSAASVATGIETFCSNNASPQSIDLRDEIQGEMITTWPLRNRGGKQANFSVLVNTSMPATLTELGFINNCSVDVRYLTDPNERQRAAVAHRDALIRHLGGTPTPTTGTLTGVVYEDRGQGIADTSVRLGGARVTIVETNDEDIASTDTASWRFELPPGSYTVRAEQSGHAPTVRTCEVMISGVTWCSIGLFVDGQTPDAGVVDSGPADSGTGDADTSPDAGETVRDGGAPVPPLPRDGGVRDSGEEPPLMKAEDADDGCACHATHDRASFAWTLLFLLPLFVRLRRRIGLVAIVLCTAPTTASAAEPYAFQGVTDVGRGSRPVIAPDGEHILVTTPNLDRVIVRSTHDASSARVVIERTGVGLTPEWSSDSRTFGVRPTRQPFAAEALMQFDLLGVYRGPQPIRAPVVQDNLQIAFGALVVSRPGIRSFAPVVDPTGTWLVYETLTEGLQLVRLADQARIALGRGSAPSFSGDGTRLIFERTNDDGHVIVASALFIVELDADRPVVIALPDGPAHERFPSLSAARGGAYTIAYDVDDRVYLGKLVQR